MTPRREWQDEAWEHFDEVPEIKYSVWFEGNVMAKVKLFVAVRDPNDPEATPIPASDPEANLPPGAAQRAQAEIDRLHGPLGGRGEIVRAANMNLEIAGECYLVGIGPREVSTTDPNTLETTVDITPERWGIYSVSQFSEQGGTVFLKDRPTGDKGTSLDPNLDTIMRIFQRHPRWTFEADCNMRGVLSDCESLVLLSNSIKAGAKSRMGAGYLLVPNELSGGPDMETEPEDGEEAEVDPFLQELYDGAVDPVEDPSSAAAVAPTMVRGASEFLKEFRHVTVDRKDDDKVLEKISAAIERIARGMNLPVEVVMGHQQTTFANATQVKQDTFDDHFQPRCVLLVDALTVSFLRPNLIEAGMDEDIADRIVIWYDPSAMIKQVNPVDSANQGIEMDLLSGEAWRRAWGWSEDDAPDPVERLVRAVMHLRSFDPGISTAILELLGVELNIPDSLPSSGSAAAAAPVRAAGMERLLAQAITAKYGRGDLGRHTLDQLLVDLLVRDPAIELSAATAALPTAAIARRNPGYDLMSVDRDLRSRVLVAADTAMTRALEKAGNKLRAKAGKNRDLSRSGFVHSVYVAAHLGPALVASSGFTDTDLIPTSSWDSLETKYRSWVTGAQERALSIAGGVVKLTAAHSQVIRQEQAAALDQSWRWFADELQSLASNRLYQPDPVAPKVGESDPSLRVPVGLVRQALARAGGATSIEPVTPSKPALLASFGADAAGSPVYVAVNNDKPLGGVGTGETISNVLEDGSAGVEGYEWVYGPAYRAHPFEDHEVLDGEMFENFDADVLVAGDWVGDYYFPGDHDGCNCDFAPVIIEPGALSDSAAAAGLTELGTPPVVDDEEPADAPSDANGKSKVGSKR